MSVNITKSYSRDKRKIWYKISWGRKQGQRIATAIFTYTKPLDQLQKNHNKESLAILEMKKSQMILDHQAIASGYIPQHKYKNNFIDFYSDFIKKNQRVGNRSLSCSLSAFKDFIDKNFISANEIDENLCERFRNYLLDNYNGETPCDYFMRFKRMLKAATKQNYFRINPAEDVQAKSKPSAKKEILAAEEYVKLMNTYCSNYEVKKAVIFCLYTGLRWCDISKLEWNSIKDNTLVMIQSKTNVPLEIPIHPIAMAIIGKRKEGRIFYLPTQDGANKILKKWALDAGINKHITWHCLRHSVSVILQDEGTDTATVAGMLGHTTTKYVQKTYQRYRFKSAEKAILKLPDLEK
jgi:integrase